MLLGPATVYGITIGCGCSAAFMLALMRIERGAALDRAIQPRLRCSAAFASCAHDRVILGTLSLDMFAVLLGGATALLPIFARDILQTGPWGLGLLRSAPAIGALTMSIVLARRPLTLPVGRVLFAVLTIYGLAVIVFALSTVLLAVAGGAGRHGRGRRGQRRDPLLARAASDARRRCAAGSARSTACSPAPRTSSAISAPASMGALFGAVPAVAIGGARHHRW